MEISIPKYVKTVLFKLSSRGYMACLVGGCVRDMALGVAPNDWDVATSALPEQVLEVFPDSLTMGLKHGTITVKIGSRHVEVTTFRSDGDYADHRHPDSVRFVGDLTTDLSRRDFTINAMAIMHDGTIIDPFRGAEDIKNGIVRAVGEPEKRFEEDALRMLRAFRFSSRLGFGIEPGTLDAIRENAPLAAALSAERVRDEIEKILLTDRPEQLYTVIDYGLLDTFLTGRLSRDDALRRIAGMQKKSLPRWAAFCYVLAAGDCTGSVSGLLKSLRLDGHTVVCCSECCELLKNAPPEDVRGWKHMLSKYGVDTVSCASQCMDIFYGGGHEAMMKKVLKSGDCFSVRHLAVNGNDLAALGLRGRQIGEMLDFLLDYVIDFPENNERGKLLALASGSEE